MLVLIRFFSADLIDFFDLNTHRSNLLEYKTKNGDKISAVLVKPSHEQDSKKYVVFSHGNGGNIYKYFA